VAVREEPKMGREWEPQLGDRVFSARLGNRLGTIRDHQDRDGSDPERWLVSPDDRREVARWLTRAELSPWTRGGV
jgi:hypothetical protein